MINFLSFGKMLITKSMKMYFHIEERIDTYALISYYVQVKNCD
jgi:hypothetical protein